VSTVTRYLAIVGPTCIGKTGYLNDIAQRYPVEVINLDSFQVYAQFAVGTGRADIQTSRAHLYGFADPGSPVPAKEYVCRVAEALTDIASRERMPVFEGGSISFLRALIAEYPLRLVGLRPPPAADVMQYVDARIARYDEDVLVAEIRSALDRGLRETLVLQDDVVYLPILDFLDGKVSHEAAFERIRVNLRRRFMQQLREYAAFDVEWIDVGADTSIRLDAILRSMLAQWG
jgi:tRNA A37 N6-isopentenylltransferase MiaA